MTIEELSSVLQMQEEITSVFQFYQCRCMGTGQSDRGRGSKRGAAVLGTDSLKQRLYRIQYGMDGTNLYHEQWLTRKENTVRLTEKSSLRMYMDLRSGRKPGRQIS